MTVVKGIDESLLPVYQQRWWLDIARGDKRYHEARVLEDGIVVGRLPYIIRRSRFGLRWAASPDWSHFGGPVTSPLLSDDEKSCVFSKLIAQLPRSISFGFSCFPYSNDGDLIKQAFVAADFEHSTEVTYSQSPNDANILDCMARKHRLHIRSARKALDIVGISEDQFIGFYSVNLEEAAIKGHASLHVARDLIAAGRAADQPQIRVTAARRKKPGAPFDAAIACIWDKTRYYFWMSTRRRRSDDGRHDKPHSDAIKMLIVEAMAHARDLGLIFDLDGVSTPGTETLYRDILKLPHVELRHIYERPTRMARWQRRHLHKLKKIAAMF
jgi:hypothetical protein